MRIKLQNIGKLKEADINIEGIAVIAGKNNTGKSTVGKALYCIFNGLYDLDRNIKADREEYYKNIIVRFLGTGSVYAGFLDNRHEIILEKSLKLIKEEDFNALKTLLLDYKDKTSGSVNIEYIRSLNTGVKAVLNFNEEELDGMIADIKRASKITNNEFYNIRLQKIFNIEFNDQINSLYTGEAGKIDLIVKNNDIGLSIANNKIKSSDYISLYTDIIYIDSPFVLDKLSVKVRKVRCIKDDITFSYRENVIRKLSDNITDKNMTNEIINTGKLNTVMQVLNDVNIGELVDSEVSPFAYKANDLPKPLEISNVSAGLKTFIILKTLILNGHIKDRGCVVLDEPEIHLHPEWQLIFAELIVLLQKEFNLHILINTHSPYFLKAIQVYSAKHKIADKCNYYLAENDSENKMSTIRDVKGSIDSIYKLLSKPFQDLEDELYK